MLPNALSINNLTYTYKKGSVKALRRLSLQLTNGIYGILGPNGAGKSTLFKLLTGELRPTQGFILWNDLPISDQWESYKSALGYMPQQQQLYPNLTVQQFLCYVAALKGLKNKAARSDIKKVVKNTGIQDILYRKTGALSGGQKQRVLLGQALLGNPDLLILDEPTAALDPKERIRIRNLIGELALDKIVLIATHLVSDIEFIGKTIYFLNAGRLILGGSLSEVLKVLDGKVFQGVIKKGEVKETLESYRVSQLRELGEDSVSIKICGDFNEISQMKSLDLKEAAPTLEDVYLYLFDEP